VLNIWIRHWSVRLSRLRSKLADDIKHITASSSVQSERLTSAWVTVGQDMITAFGRITLDPDSMHDDPDWAAVHSPYGQTIAYGFLTISLLTYFFHTAESKNSSPKARRGHYLNYGFDRLRLVSPVKVGARLRCHFSPMEPCTEIAGRILRRYYCEIEIEKITKPALIAEWLTYWVPDTK
jgi:acyl dehydratase